MKNSTQENLNKLYEQDYLAWYEITLEQIKHRRLNELDLDSLIEVLENLVRDTKRNGESYLRQILIHLLMLEYWDNERDYNYRHWIGEIINFRNELDIDMTTNLWYYLQQQKDKIYKKAVKYVIVKTSLDKNIFPNECPYSLEQLLDEDWLPIQDN